MNRNTQSNSGRSRPISYTWMNCALKAMSKINNFWYTGSVRLLKSSIYRTLRQDSGDIRESRKQGPPAKLSKE